MSEKFIKYLINEIFDNPEVNFKIEDEFIKLRFKDKIYTENVFNMYGEFSKDEISVLLDVSSKIIENKKSTFNDFPLIKAWYYITHEKALKNLSLTSMED